MVYVAGGLEDFSPSDVRTESLFLRGLGDEERNDT